MKRKRISKTERVFTTKFKINDTKTYINNFLAWGHSRSNQRDKQDAQ